MFNFCDKDTCGKHKIITITSLLIIFIYILMDNNAFSNTTEMNIFHQVNAEYMLSILELFHSHQVNMIKIVP